MYIMYLQQGTFLQSGEFHRFGKISPFLEKIYYKKWVFLLDNLPT